MKSLTLFLIVIAFQNSIAQDPELHIIGGFNEEVYLGCFNCHYKDKNSIWNMSGKFGNNRSKSSIWNLKSQYGSITSPFSAFNELALAPPLIIDNDGNFYGYLSLNKNIKDRADTPEAEMIYMFEKGIRNDNLKKWYKIIY